MVNDDRHYDVIIAGAGLAGLSLLMRLIDNGWARGKKILLADRDPKKTNDRTWCFWEEGDGYFEKIVHARWDRMWFRSHHGAQLLDLSPYSYKLIRGIDLYGHCFRAIGNVPGITFKLAHIDRIFSDHDGTGIVADGTTYTSRIVFNSIRDDGQLDRSRSVNLLQHFKGWWIRTVDDVFDPSIGTLMDFRTDQRNGATFFYVLPVSQTEALIEYTIFSDALLSQEEYDRALRDHIRHALRIDGYHISHQEFGVIPMTDAKFPSGEGNIINIGTAGGCTKPSTGYTFQFVQQQSEAIADALSEGDDLRNLRSPHSDRFAFYDSVFLNVLKADPIGSDRIFSQLFLNNRPDRILRFLSGKSKPGEHLAIISTMPTLPFLKAAIGRAFK